MDFVLKERYNVQDLLKIVELLRAPDGCPWDREQTHQSIRKNLIEETYEVADAIDQEAPELLCEELGDLLLQVMLHTEMEKEKGRFDFEDVCNGICQKLIYRHPHIFANKDKAISTVQVLNNWENLKKAEKGRNTAKENLDSVPASLPALMRTEKIQKRAASFGFRYADVNAALQDLKAEVAELEEAIKNNTNAPEEVGDVLFSAVNVARFIKTDAEEALTQSSNKFANRVKRCEDMAHEKDKALPDIDAKTLDDMWKAAKAEEKA